MKRYDVDEASQAQSEYCKRNNAPNFAGDGSCFRCGRNVYCLMTHGDGSITGTTVEEAGQKHITGCPHCHCSFVD